MTTALILCAPFLSEAQNVGIGTNTPTARLHIEVPSGFTIPVLQVNQQGSATPYLIVQPDGKVGIGVANPSEALDVSGNIQFSGALMPGGNAGTAGQVLVSQGSGVAPVWQTLNIPPQGNSVCSTVINNYLQKWTGTELCNSIIYDDGTNVGIGTISPAVKLHVVGDIVGVSTLHLVGSGSGLEGGQINLADPNQTGIGQTNAWSIDNYGGDLRFFYNGGPIRMLIDNLTGNVGIGTTSPSQKLDVVGNVQFSGALMPGGNAGSPGQVLVSQGPGIPPQWQNVNSGPVFINPVTVYSGGGPVGWTTYNAASVIPAGATAVILEAECAISSPDGGDVDAHIRIRRDASSPSYVLVRGRSAGGGDNIALANQGIFPITSTRTFQYTIENPGFNGGCAIRIVGYYAQ